MDSKPLIQKNMADFELREILDLSPVGISWCNSEGDIEYMNHRFRDLFGYSLDDIPDITTWERKAYPDSAFREETLEQWKTIVDACRASGDKVPPFESHITCRNGSTRRVVTKVSWLGECLMANFVDNTEHWKSDQRSQAHKAMLEMIAKGEAISHILSAIVSEIECEDPTAKCSILLLDDEGKHLFQGAAPSLPPFYNEALEGIEIGVGVGSCGTAAFIGKRVIVEDLSTHEYWRPYLELAQQAGLGSCWSEPIVSSTGKVLGTFAIYHATPSHPTNDDIERISFAANLAVIAIENQQNREELIKRERKFSSLAENAPDNIARYNTLGQIIYANPRLLTSLNSTLKEVLGKRPTERYHGHQNDEYEAALFKVIDSGEPVEVELCIPAEGGMRYHRVNMAAERDECGNVVSVLAIGRDITERRIMETQLSAREQEFRSLAEASPDNIIRYDRQGRIRYINRNLLSFLKFDSAEKAIGRRPIEVWPDGRYQSTEDSVDRVMTSGIIETVELSLALPNGKNIYHHLMTVPERNDQGDIVGAIVFGRDFTQLKQVEIALEKSNARFLRLFESSPEPVWIFDQGRCLDCNQAAVDMLGYTDKSVLIGGHPAELSPPTQPDGSESFDKAERMIRIANDQGRHCFEWVCRRADGSDFTADVTLSLIELDDRPVVYGIWRDITERKKMEVELERRAHFDALTGLANRHHFIQRAGDELSRIKRFGGDVSLIMFDIDHFKQFNDTYGHSVGDRVLTCVAKITVDIMREIDVVGRFGGEEFVILLPKTKLQSAVIVAERLRTAIEAGGVLLEDSHTLLSVTASMGVATQIGGGEFEDLLKRVDTAMYAAKAKGRNQVCLALD